MSEPLDVLFLGAVMNFDGHIGSHAHYVRRGDRWLAPFQYIYEQHPDKFASEGDACVYSMPNLSIAKLADYLKRRLPDLRQHIVWHFDYRKEEVLDLLQNDPPRLVAVSSTLAFYPQFLCDAVRWINQHKQPETKVVVGGKWIYDRYKALKASKGLETIFVQGAADYYVINGYGEEALHQLLLAERKGDRSRAQSLPNVAYRKRDAVPGNGTVPEYEGRYYRINKMVDETQTPGFPMIDFTNVGEQFLGKVVHVRTAVSCPFSCRFCTFPVLQGEHQLFDTDAVVAQLRQLKSMGVEYLYFIDDTFNVPKRRFEELLDRIIAARLGMQWVGFFRAQYADADIVKKMHEAGCRMVFCGFESGNDAILKAMDKHVTVSQYEAGLSYLDRAGIEVMASYIVGYPGETYQTAMDTLRLMSDPRVGFSRGGLFYYETNAPVSRFAGEWALKGSGAEWVHHTMNSQEAQAIHLEMVQKLTGVNIPVSDGGGWNNFHLFARGIPFADQKRLFRDFNAIQGQQIREAGKDAVAGYRAFAQTGGKTEEPATAPIGSGGSENFMPAMDF